MNDPAFYSSAEFDPYCTHFPVFAREYCTKQNLTIVPSSFTTAIRRDLSTQWTTKAKMLLAARQQRVAEKAFMALYGPHTDFPH
jgi:hypothetical protein